MVMRVVFSFGVVSVLLLVGCNTDENPDSDPQQISQDATALPSLIPVTDTETFTPAPPSDTPSPTGTPAPTITPEPPTPTITPSPSPVPTIGAQVIANQVVNVRTGPGTEYDIFGTASPSEDVELIGRNVDGDWYEVKFANGDTGWMLNRLLDIPPDSDLPITEPGYVDESAPLTTDNNTLPNVDLDAADMTLDSLLAAAPQVATEIADVEATDEATVDPQRTELPSLDADLLLPTVPPTTPPPTVPPVEVASGTGVDIFAFCDNPTYGISAPIIEANSTIEIYWAWFAFSEAQVQHHITTVEYDLRVNGDPIEIFPQYQKPVSQQSGQHVAFWYVPFGPLESGDYTITIEMIWSEAISDGVERFGPNTDNETFEESCTFTAR